MIYTTEKIESINKFWDVIAKEDVFIQEDDNGNLVGFCSELGALRIFHSYSNAEHIVGYSHVMKKHFFKLTN